jgi:hypothetical protein
VIEAFCLLPLKAEIHAMPVTKLYINRRTIGTAVPCIHLGRLKTTVWQRMGNLKYFFSGKFLPYSILEMFFSFFVFFSVCFKKMCLIRLFQKGSETPKQTKKMFYSFAKQTENQPRQIECWFASGRT